MLRKIVIASVVLWGASIASSAATKSLVDIQRDSVIASHRIIYLNDDDKPKAYSDSAKIAIESFYYDQFRHFQAPDAPYFLFMSKDAKLAMGIGGCVRMRGWYDWDGAQPTSAFSPYLIPIDKNPAKMRHFDTTPAGTCLFFRVIGRNKTLGYYQLYIEANFNGYQSRDFHLKKAYAIINDFTIGYANSTFSDPAAVPATVDANGPNNKISPTSVLVRWMPTIKNRYTFALSVETPSQQVDVDNVRTSKVDSWMPDFAAFAQYQWSRGEHVRLAGIVRTMSYRDLVAGKNHNTVGWGLQLSSVAHPWAPVTTYATVSYGKGYGSMGGDLQVGSYDLVGDAAKPGHMYAPASYGWNIGLQYNFKPNLFTTVTASQTRYLPKNGIDGNEYKYGLFFAANVFWNLTPRMQVGAEFDLGKRQNFDGSHEWGQRIGAMAQFSF